MKQLEKFHCCLETSKWQTPQNDTDFATHYAGKNASFTVNTFNTSLMIAVKQKDKQKDS